MIVPIVLAILAFAGGTASAATLTNDNFEDGDAAGWTTTGGTWIVTTESSRVLHQSSFAANALARTGTLAWQNYTVAADVKPDSFNGLPGYLGLVSRAASTTTYYGVVLRADDTVALIRYANGITSTLASARFNVDLGATYRLALRTNGQSLTGSVGGVTVSASDAFITNGGPAGLLTTWATASFDNVSVVS